MSGGVETAVANLLSPPVLFFALGFLAARAKSDLSLPEPLSRGLSLYLMAAIGWKGGAELARAGLHGDIAVTLLSAALFSLALPLLAFLLIRWFARLAARDAAVIAAHYGSVSVVTFVAATGFLSAQGVPFEGHMVATMAVMEGPPILTGLFLASRFAVDGPTRPALSWALVHKVAACGSLVLLMGSFAIAWTTGDKGAAALAPALVAPFPGVLCFFLLDMGLLVGRRAGRGMGLEAGLVAFGLGMPLVGASLGLLLGWALGLSQGGITLMAVLAGSASYIVVPAAMRLALPQARNEAAISLALAVTFPFNLLVGIPLYFHAARKIVGAG